jgi:DNA-binding NtrC family response regulator/predicted TIM-barrel enzyme
VLAVVAGSGIVARCAVAAGADFLLALAAGVYRNLGRGTLASFLPFGNSNQQTLSLLREHVLPQAGNMPVIAGVCAADPMIDLDAHLRQLRRLGVAGVTNWPAVGFIDGRFREAIEEAGWGADVEIELLRRARAMGLVSCGFVLDERQTRDYAQHSDVLILNMGLTHRIEDIPDRQDQVRQAIAHLNQMLTAVPRGAGRPLCLAFGGPVTTAEDLEQLLRQSNVDGFAGGSVFERLPVQSIVGSTIRRFRSVMFRSRADHDTGIGDLIGVGEAFRHLKETITRVAPYDVNVYIHGETGTGKELVASQIHRLSRRARGPMVTLNCGAIPDPLLESELFGHERGAFTGAERRRLGKFELAHHGTLFLDEVADLSPRGQVALLRAIQTGEIARVGAEQRIDVDVRIIAASHQDLSKLVAAGRFREDLFYRLNQITIDVRPLRERLEDIPLLVEAILARLRIRLNREILGLSDSFHGRLREHRWPGNVRELEHVICRAAILERNPVLEGTFFVPFGEAHPMIRASPAAAQAPAESKPALAREAIHRAAGNKSLAARSLGVSRKTLYAWLNA